MSRELTSTYIPIRYYVTPGRWRAYVIVDRQVGGVVAEFDKRVEAQREVLRLRLEHEAELGRGGDALYGDVLA